MGFEPRVGEGVGVGTARTGMFVQMVGPSVDIPGGEVAGGKGRPWWSTLSAAWSEVTLLPRQVQARRDRWSISLDEVVLIALVATTTARLPESDEGKGASPWWRRSLPGAVGSHTSAAPGEAKGRSLVDPACVVGGFGRSVDASHAEDDDEIEHSRATCSALTASCQKD